MYAGGPYNSAVEPFCIHIIHTYYSTTSFFASHYYVPGKRFFCGILYRGNTREHTSRKLRQYVCLRTWDFDLTRTNRRRRYTSPSVLPWRSCLVMDLLLNYVLCSFSGSLIISSLPRSSCLYSRTPVISGSLTPHGIYSVASAQTVSHARHT